jgi:hypothetical protein
MKKINTKTHGVLDYLVAVLFIALPWILNFDEYPTPTMVFVVTGIVTLIYSAVTNYEMGLIPIISMKSHLALDTIAGVFLIASPWLLNFNDVIYLPFVILGAMELLVVILSDSISKTATHTVKRVEKI